MRHALSSISISVSVYIICIPFILFLGLLYILWNGLFLNPVYNPVSTNIGTNIGTNIANTPNYIFDSPAQTQQFHSLLKEFRCLTCQNQSLADSTAPIALNMRQVIYSQLKQGHTELEIRDSLVEHYGDFVLYNPPLKKETILLWLGPVLFFLIGFGFAIKQIIH